MQSTSVFLPGKCHRLLSLVDYSPWGRRIGHDGETEHTHLDAGKQSPLHYGSSRPQDREALSGNTILCEITSWFSFWKHCMSWPPDLMSLWSEPMAAQQLTSDIPSQGYSSLTSDPSAFSYLELHPLLSLLPSSVSDQSKQLFMGSYCWEIRSGFHKFKMLKHILFLLPPSVGEGNGNPLQFSCLKNPVDCGAWWAVVHRVTESWTWLK